MATLAVVFDFDDTLLPDTTSALLESHGIDSAEFWSDRVKRLVDEGYDPPLAYLNLLLDEIGADKPLGELRNADLAAFGASLDNTWFVGLPEMFQDVRELVDRHRDVAVEFYIVSGGLQDLIGGSSIVQANFDGFYGCQLGGDDNGVLRYVKRCVTFTEKTRFLFEINKGISSHDSRTQPHLVNRDIPEADRRIPWNRMIYVGDGLTDIPCFSLVKGRGGTTFGVLKRGKESAKQAFQEFLKTDRVMGMHSPDYREDGDLGSLVRTAVAHVAAGIQIERERAL